MAKGGTNAATEEDEAMSKSMTIGQRINIFRLQRHMTMKKLAKAINISISTYYGWLYRDAHPDIDSLIMIADLFDMSLDELVGREYHSSKPHERGG